MMENENFDEELKNRIKQVFEEYNDSTANEGWDLLREKYPEKKRRDSFIWWISAAALLLIALIFGLFKADFYQKNASKIVHQHKTDTASVSPNRYSSTQKSFSNKITASTSNTKKTSIKTTSGFATKRLSQANNLAQNQVFAKSLNIQKTLVKTASGFISEQTTISNNQAILATSQQKLQPKTEVDKSKNTFFTGTKNDSNNIIKQNKFLNDVVKDSSKQKPLTTIAKTTNPTFAKPAVKKYTEAEISKKTIEKSSVFSLEIYAGSHVNYATGSNNQLGLGAGFSTDFRLSKNFKLSTGLGLMQNNLTYGQDIPRGSLDAASVTYSAASTNVSGLVTTVQPPSLNTMGTRLLALDVPINLVYNISPGKNSISVSAGLSSNTFVKEAYDYHYSNLKNTTQNIKSFNSFNFAKTLNLAAGFAYPLGKSQLQIEPFLKYPLGGSGSQQLQFGSAGINLKMNIRSFKK